uniref:Plac8 onzin related protein 6 n=1 Tax=Periophthalmus magnuspinnatus TaxID=409849 RepID=A0A3B4BBY0_9GOBI
MARYSKANEVEWSSGLCDCFEDSKTCCYGFWCCPCLACTVSGRFQENRCLPLCDIFSPAIVAVAVRHRYKIKGTICRDICTSCFCVWCSWCQLHRELRAQDKGPITVNVTNVVHAQPVPMMMVNQNVR